MSPNDAGRLLVTGSRYHTDRDKVARTLRPFAQPGRVLVHGKAPGLDMLCRDVWTELGLPALGIPAEWDKYGNRAGPIRNQAMVDLGGYVACVAFPGPGSVGTWDCVRRAVAADIPTLVVQ